MAKGIYELAMALKAYEESNGEKKSSVNAMMEATSWSYQIASLYYDMFRSDGIRHWREKTATWAEHITGEKGGQAGKGASMEASPAIPLGRGTKDCPYLIGNAAQLDWFRDKVNGGEDYIHGALIANITYNVGMDVEGYDGKSPNSFTPFTPIAPNSTGYKGSFDGRGNTISGLYINTDDSSWCGLFGMVASGGVVENIIIRNSYISTSHAKASVRLGGIAGANYGTINCCDVSAAIDAKSGLSRVESASIRCGGITGTNNGTASVNDCIYSGPVDVSGTATTYIYCGGIVGYNSDMANVSACTCSGSVDISGTAMTFLQCGGIMGYNGSTASDCTCSGSVNVSGTATTYIYCGGIAGGNGGTASNCTMSGSVAVRGIATNIYCGGIMGITGSPSRITGCACSGNVSVSGTAGSGIYCGSLIGGSWATLTVTDCTCLGNTRAATTSGHYGE